jgi:biotin transporter BioY
MKRCLPFLVFIFVVLLCGCAADGTKTPAAKATGSQTIVTPVTSFNAKVVSCNSVGRFVVLSFPVGPMPSVGQSFFVYRNGLKTGQVKIDLWQRDNLVVADVVNGDAQVGDEARAQ